jgi:hypothetical protein
MIYQISKVHLSFREEEHFAYEVGALTVLCKELTYEYREGPLFDIVAGTSIGAMNAAVLISNIVNRKKT